MFLRFEKSKLGGGKLWVKQIFETRCLEFGPLRLLFFSTLPFVWLMLDAKYLNKKRKNNNDKNENEKCLSTYSKILPFIVEVFEQIINETFYFAWEKKTKKKNLKHSSILKRWRLKSNQKMGYYYNIHMYGNIIRILCLPFHMISHLSIDWVRNVRFLQIYFAILLIFFLFFVSFVFLYWFELLVYRFYSIVL